MYDTKTLEELEKIAANLQRQIALHPLRRSARTQLNECERWIEVRRRELDPNFQSPRTNA